MEAWKSGDSGMPFCVIVARNQWQELCATLSKIAQWLLLLDYWSTKQTDVGSKAHPPHGQTKPCPVNQGQEPA